MFVCLFVCLQDYGETTGPTFMKLGGRIFHLFFFLLANVRHGHQVLKWAQAKQNAATGETLRQHTVFDRILCFLNFTAGQTAISKMDNVRVSLVLL